MSERAKLNFLSLLLLLALGVVVLAIVNTWQAVTNFQQMSTATKAGDVTTIRPWMTIHVISRVYHVPEDYLTNSLQVKKTDPLHHATLYEIAARKRQPVDRLIRTLKNIILIYRKQHPGSSLPVQPTRSPIENYFAPPPGETKE